jgi:hypothetical protein
MGKNRSLQRWRALIAGAGRSSSIVKAEAEAARMLDRHTCYELCVQSPRFVTQFLRAVHGGDPRVLREDFCGTAAISRRWLSEATRAGVQARAVAVDVDPEALAFARASAEPGMHGLAFVGADCVQIGVNAGAGSLDPCDVVFVGNFSIGYIHERSRLLEYLRRSRERLTLGSAGWGGGVFVCDMYDNGAKFSLGSIRRTHPSRGRELIHYTWEHRSADVLTGIVTNAIHFRVELDGEIVQEHTDAFVYVWRLWSFAELRDAMVEAGFADVRVYAEVGDVKPEPISTGDELPASGIGLLVARA